MVILDVAVVNIALPEMRAGLHFSTTGLQWVVNAYTITFAGFMLLGARAADLLGRRRVFVAGVVLFAAASLACATADSRGMLIAVRALQGFAGGRAPNAIAASACGARSAALAPHREPCSAAC
jgi:MFS family permease